MKINSLLVQLVEQRSSKPCVAGSSPARGTTVTGVLLVCSLALCAPAGAAKPSREKAVAHAQKKGSNKPTAAPAAQSTKRAAPRKPGVPPKQAKGKHAQLAPPRSNTTAKPEPDPAPRTVLLQKASVPVRTEMGCSDQGGALLAVGQVLKSDGKTYRCQTTWDYADGKLVGYPAWVELFMPTPGWGAGLRETTPPPTDARVPPATVTPSVGKVGPPELAPTTAKDPSSQTSPNYLY
jgi:hypothetical protein